MCVCVCVCVCEFDEQIFIYDFHYKFISLKFVRQIDIY